MYISHDGVTIRFKTEPEELFLAEKSGVKPNTVCIIDNDEYEMLNTHMPKKIIIQYQEEIFIRTITNLYFAKLFGHVIVIVSWTNEAHHHPIPGDTEPCDSCRHSQRLDDSGEKSTGDVREEEGTPVGPHSVPVVPGAHNLGPQEPISPAETTAASEEAATDARVIDIVISKQLFADLASIAHGRSKNKVIQELLDRYISTSHQHTPPVSEPPLGVQAIHITIPLREKLDALRGSKTYDEVIAGLIIPPIKLDPVLLPINLINDLGMHQEGKSYAEFIQELLETYLDKQAEERGHLHDWHGTRK